MSREISLDDPENVPFMQQVNTQEGDVYLINTDVYHSFKCVGNNHRFILQTKFDCLVTRKHSGNTLAL